MIRQVLCQANSGPLILIAGAQGLKIGVVPQFREPSGQWQMILDRLRGASVSGS